MKEGMIKQCLKVENMKWVFGHFQV